MNLSKLMNDGNEEQEKKKSPELSRTAQPSSLVADAGRHPSQPGYAVQPGQSPSYQPPAQPPGLGKPSSQSLTPLQVPPQGTGPGQHYIQPPPAQSPAGTQQYRPFDNYSATTPSARPGSHGYGYPQPSPSHPYAGLPGAAHAHTHSLSPTPSSHHSQTPHSVRQSPLSSLSHGQHSQLPYQNPQHSQPSTPLGPPPPQFSRSTTQPDLGSPYHQRNYSGASNGLPSGSPAQHHHPPPGNFVESPNATYNRPSPHLRRTSDYISHIDRERSVSVSPKTKVPARPPSLDSRHSSQQDVYGTHRNSAQTHMAGSPSHVTHPYHPGGPPPQPPAQSPNQANEVSQPTPSSFQGVPNSYPRPGVADDSTSLSQRSSQPSAPPPLLQHHSSQKMGMSNLLTPSSEPTPTVNGNSTPAPETKHENMASRPAPSIFMKPSPKPKAAAAISTPSQVQSDGQANQPMEAAELQSSEAKPSLKRSATESSSQEPPSKQRKTTTRKYAQRPPWAVLSKYNPGHQRQGHIPNGDFNQRALRPHISNAPQTNGGYTDYEAVLDRDDRWNIEPPLDFDLISARSVLGAWEKTFLWKTPSSDMLNVLQQYLWQNLEQLGDAGMDPREGTVEIEAKIGTLVDNNTDRRLQLPVSSMCVITPDPQGNRYSFRSEMDVHEHKHLNDYLNAVIKVANNSEGRKNLSYKHLYETDSFHQLSSTGLSLLPKALQRHHNNKKDRLRITTDSKTGLVKARLVKIKISDLHIFNPSSYDCRITINLEVNLDRPDIDPTTLIAAEDAQARNELPRIKDRVSYKHLAYSIDLTKVEMQGMPARYELEQEVDSTLLRRQMVLVKEGQRNAFTEVVSGFLDNLTWLMREKGKTEVKL